MEIPSYLLCNGSPKMTGPRRLHVFVRVRLIDHERRLRVTRLHHEGQHQLVSAIFCQGLKSLMNDLRPLAVKAAEWVFERSTEERWLDDHSRGFIFLYFSGLKALGSILFKSGIHERGLEFYLKDMWEVSL